MFYVNFGPFLDHFWCHKAGEKSMNSGKKGLQKKERDKVIFGQNTTFQGHFFLDPLFVSLVVPMKEFGEKEGPKSG